MNKKVFAGIAAAALLAASSCAASAVGFAKANTYTDGMFADVPAAEWYADSVASSYELGFMRGTGDSVFSPEGNMTVAEAVTIAARVHDAYNAKGTKFGAGSANWYDDYVSYAVANGIIADGQFDDYDRPAKRHEMASIFASAVPADFLEAKNNVTEIPDVPVTNKYFEKLQLLYNAGVIMGNDEFGTFKPNNNVTRAEAAAIINRVALPESRLQKKLVDANYGDGFYLINDGSSKFNIGDLGSSTTSAWIIDNRAGATSNTSGPSGLYDFNPEMPVEVWRDIDDVTDGIIGFEFLADIQFGENGAYFRITDDEKNAVISLDTKDSHFYFGGTDTGVEVKQGRYYVKIRADLDHKTAELYINGKKIGTEYKVNDGVASRVAIGSDKEGVAYIVLSCCDVYKDYLVKESFFDPVGSALSAWEVTGSAEVVRAGGQGYADYNSAKLAGGAVAKKSFNKISGKVIFESYMLFPKAEDTGYVSLNSGDTTVAKFVINADGVFKADGTKLRFHNNNIWQTLRMEVDTTEGTVTYKVNGKIVGTFATDVPVSTVDNVTFGATGGSVYFDDVHVSLAHEYDDYCPTPVPVTDDGYDVILNVCSLWHEGSHSGWGAISAYPDLEPALGFYDEGIVETADWEIKFMVENGIDVQHFCWYSPSGDIKEPIKQSNLNWALHDGYFNAEYSDMMKFTFMWENNGVNAYSWEQFKEYIWDYWMDYYFTDERFYTIDNKLAFTVWNFNNFKKTFGDEAGCREAVRLMNEDAKAHGFDGVLLFFADSHRQDAASFEQMANMGATGAYAYHWQQDGNSAEKSINRLQKNQDFGKLHIVPTVSVGFNNVGWSGVRKPLISVEDHKKVASYIKDTYLPKLDGWKAKTMIVSTWNEYGEGTYVMPSKGLHGFGYLENIAEVFAGVTDHSNNIYPTEQQKARLGHLYPKSKTSLEHLDIEKPEETAPAKVLYSATGADMKALMRIAELTFDGDTAIARQEENDGALTLREDKVFAPMDMSEIVAVRVTLKSSIDAYSELFFATKDSPNYTQDKSLNFNITKSDEFNTYTIYTSTCAAWSGTLTNFRLDILNKPGVFEVSKFELLGYSDEQLPIKIYSGLNEYSPLFPPVEKNGELYVTTAADKGFFRIHNFYYEWSRFTGKLRILTADNKEVIFTVGSDKALVNGAEKQLKEPVTLTDGLPVIPLYFLYDAVGVSYTVENKTVKAKLAMTDFDAKNEEIIKSRIPYEYEFNLDYDLEGFSAGNTTLTVSDGALKGTALLKDNGTYDPIVNVKGLDIDASKYNKLVVAIKYDTGKESGEHLHVYFTTEADTTANEAKSYGVNMEANPADGSYGVYEFDLTQNELWTGTVTYLRVDPIGGAGSFDIDYIRVIADNSIKEANEAAEREKLAKGFEIVNGDAEDTENVAFFGNDGKEGGSISIVFDDEKQSNVYHAKCDVHYTYIRQSVIFEPGKTYTVKVDVKAVETNAGGKDFKTKFHCNARYNGTDGKRDHVVHGVDIASSDGWKTIEFSFTLPDDFTPSTTDEFTFYTNPADGSGVQFRMDNLTVDCK